MSDLKTIKIPAGLRVAVRDSGVAVMTIDRPDRANSLDDTLLTGLADIVEAVCAAEEVRALVLTGTGRFFCSGADLDARGFALASVEDSAAYSGRTHRTAVALHAATVPTIAAVNGAAVGGGFGLALACDLRVAAPSAVFRAPFVTMGMTPHFGVSYFLPRLVGEARAIELVCSGRKVGVDEALRLGLVTEVADDAVHCAVEIAETFSTNPPHAVSAAKHLIQRADRSDFRDHVLRDEPRANAIALHGNEFRVAFAAYQESVRNRKR